MRDNRGHRQQSPNWSSPPGPEPPPVIRRPPGYRPPPSAEPPTRQPPPARTPQRGHRPAAPQQSPKPAPRPPTRPDRSRSRRLRRWWLSALALLLVGVLVAPVGICVWAELSLHRAWVFADYPGRPAPTPGTTWLLVGSDNRADLPPERQSDLTTGGDVGGGRTDTIILVHIPARAGNVGPTVVSIPRDSYVPIPGYGDDKINAAFSLGGAPLLTQTVEQAIGIRLDHYMEIGFAGFADVVDALGGVTMCLAEPIDDPLAGINLPAGCQRLDGRDALGYVRSRATPRADLDRMVHQRDFISAVLSRAASPAVWLNPLRWFPVADAAVGALTVDAGVHVWDLAQLGWALRGSERTTTVPIAGFSTVSSGDIVRWDQDAASRLFEALRTDSPVPEDVLEPQP